MQQYGNASVYGVDGTVAISGVAAALMVESAEGEHRGGVEEFINGLGKLIGFKKVDERSYVDLTLIPKVTAASGSLNSAKGALAYPTAPCKITLSGFVDTTSPTLGINGDYIYVGGARRTQVRGQAALRLQIFKPMDSDSLTVDQLVTLAT